MGKLFQGTAKHFEDYSGTVVSPLTSDILSPIAPKASAAEVIEVIKEIPIEIFIEKEVIKYVDRPVEIIKEVEKIVTKTIVKEIEVIKHVPKEIEKEVIKYVDKHIEIIKEIEKEIIKGVLPLWAKVALIAQGLLIIGLLIK